MIFIGDGQLSSLLDPLLDPQAPDEDILSAFPVLASKLLDACTTIPLRTDGMPPDVFLHAMAELLDRRFQGGEEEESGWLHAAAISAGTPGGPAFLTAIPGDDGAPDEPKARLSEVEETVGALLRAARPMGWNVATRIIDNALTCSPFFLNDLIAERPSIDGLSFHERLELDIILRDFGGRGPKADG